LRLVVPQSEIRNTDIRQTDESRIFTLDSALVAVPTQMESPSYLRDGFTGGEIS